MKRRIGNIFNKVNALATSAAITVALAMSGTAMAIDAGTATKKAQKIADYLTYVFPLMGAFFVLSGAIKWVMAFRSEQPEQQASAVKEIIIGIVCIVFRAFLWSPIAEVVFDPS